MGGWRGSLAGDWRGTGGGIGGGLAGGGGQLDAKFFKSIPVFRL
jgi:hypothetical protein